MAQQIFISYSRVDTDNAERLIKRLRNTFPDTTIWYDSHLKGRGGQKWWDVILDAIEGSEIFLYLLSNDSLASPYCQAEFEEAQRLDRPFIAVQLRHRTQIPDTLTDYQYIDLTATGEDDPYDNLVGSILRLLPNGARAKRKRFPRKHRTPKPGKSEDTTVTEEDDVVTPPFVIPSPAQQTGGITLQYMIAIIGAIAVILAAIISILPAILDRVDNTKATQTALALTQIAQNPTNIGIVSETPSDIPTATATLSTTEVEETIIAEMATIQAEALLHQEATQTAVAEVTTIANETAVVAQTLTATSWTDTPTPDLRATAEARLTQAAIDATSTAENHPRSIAQRPINSNEDWRPYIEEFDEVEMVLVPAGCFIIGASPEFGDERNGNEICFDEPFWIDRTEVTQEQFRRFDGDAEQSSIFIGDNRPVENITWFEARTFCRRRGVRLPTEPEWEYAARGPDELIYPWGNQFVAENVVFGDSFNSQTANVGSLPAGASWVGALDMSGNVWEWINSLYQQYPYESDHEIITISTDSRILRGGSWSGNATSHLRAANRLPSNPDASTQLIGFRCARNV
jgi:hypothetical protein